MAARKKEQAESEIKVVQPLTREEMITLANEDIRRRRK